MRDAVGRVATVVAYFEAMGITVYVPYRVGDAVARSAASTEASTLPDEAAGSSYAIERSRYLAARDTGCGPGAAASR